MQEQDDSTHGPADNGEEESHEAFSEGIDEAVGNNNQEVEEEAEIEINEETNNTSCDTITK